MANVSTLFTTYRKFWSQIAPMCGQIRYVLRLFLRDKLDKRLWSSHLWSTPKIEVNSFFWTRLGWSLYIDIILVLILVFCSLYSLLSSPSFLYFFISNSLFFFLSHLLSLRLYFLYFFNFKISLSLSGLSLYLFFFFSLSLSLPLYLPSFSLSLDYFLSLSPCN